MHDYTDEKMVDTLQAVMKARYGHTVTVPDGVQGLPELLRIARQTSHRAWADRPVGADLVRLLAACALAAPSKSHLQQADIIDVRDPVRRAAIHKLVPGMPWMADAPALLVFCANGRRFKRLFERRGLPFANDHLDGFFNPVVDASLVMMNFIHAAGATGLVGCPISMIRNLPQRLAEILELPERVVPVAGLCLGYPMYTREVVPRMALTATLHLDRFDATDDDIAVDEFDRRVVASRTAMLPSTTAAPRAWSDERAQQYATPQRADWGRFVREAGFDLG
ncbi:nitroreductase family protein [Delftia tsuruhatensis]|nr:nitroreductase family protein [Delftia tsuruhatensis]